MHGEPLAKAVEPPDVEPAARNGEVDVPPDHDPERATPDGVRLADRSQRGDQIEIREHLVSLDLQPLLSLQLLTGRRHEHILPLAGDALVCASGPGR